MTMQPKRKDTGAAGGKTPASLLTVPLFKPQTGRRYARHPRASESVASPPCHATPQAVETPPSERRAPPSAPPAAAPARQDIDGTAGPAPEAAGARDPDRDLRRYWRRVGHGGDAAIEDLDAGLIGRRWPNTLLIRVGQGGLLDIVRVFAPEPGAGNAAPACHPFAGDQYSRLSTWVLDLAREAAGGTAPVETTECFAIGEGRKSFRVCALPCRSRADAGDYVLLNIGEA